MSESDNNSSSRDESGGLQFDDEDDPVWDAYAKKLQRELKRRKEQRQQPGQIPPPEQTPLDQVSPPPELPHEPVNRVEIESHNVEHPPIPITQARDKLFRS